MSRFGTCHGFVAHKNRGYRQNGSRYCFQFEKSDKFARDQDLCSCPSNLPPRRGVTVHGHCRSVLRIESVRRHEMLQLFQCRPGMNLL